MAKVEVILESCKGVEDCGLCIEVCPKQALTPSTQANARGYLPPLANKAEACAGCGSCMRICPDYAIIVKTLEEA